MAGRHQQMSWGSPPVEPTRTPSTSPLITDCMVVGTAQ
jgi:hypothetical protein